MTDLERHYTRTFSGASGIAVLQHLRRITVARTLGPNATDAELRTLEGQRALVRQIETMITRGAQS